ncbi:beta-galactosidase trimerization domain-containing protein [Nonomuraea sp. NPDC003707]
MTVTNAFAALRLLPMSDRDKDVEILVLRHQIAILERQLGADTRVTFMPEDRALLTALLTSLPREILRRLRLLVRPDTVLRWHRDLMRRRHSLKGVNTPFTVVSYPAAEVLSTYKTGEYAGRPAVTLRRAGTGSAACVSTRLARTA